MGRKEATTKEDLMTVIGILENAGITYWIDGGWGVDILAGKQTRTHRDIDINFDAQHTEKLLNVLLNLGYKIDTDWKPVRIELYSDVSRPRQHRHLKRKNSILFLVFLDFPHFFIHSGWQDTLF